MERPDKQRPVPVVRVTVIKGQFQLHQLQNGDWIIVEVEEVEDGEPG